MDEPRPTWHPAPSPPDLRLPAGAVDTHCHVFGPRAVFPFDPASRYIPGDAPKERLFALHDMLGIARRVIVQAGVHGHDNSVVADAIAARPETTRGIALAPPDIDSAAIARLAAQGFFGLRFNYMAHLPPGASPDALRALAPRLAEAGWHLVIHTEPGRLADLAPLLAALPVPVVIDHMARIRVADAASNAAFGELLRLMEQPHLWVKVSGCERASSRPWPHPDATPFASRLVEAFPDRVLWGTDWPHPNFGGLAPDDGLLVDLLARIAPDASALQRLLVDNPARLYGFPAESDDRPPSAAHGLG